MTQQEIVDAVNRLTVGYNVSWSDIKTDADKAIYKINSYLGASYPLMSDILNSPFASYALKHNGKYIPIFGDQYITSIVIPYIASEILSRDEEFTTIYNKYLLEVEDGLFTMFSNEFNRVPPVFRQPETTGVFFADNVPQKRLEHDIIKHLPKITFKINYHMNNDNVLTNTYYVDNKEYNYNEEYTLLPINTDPYYSPNGLRKYTLNDWYYDPMYTNRASDGNITSDIDIYAKWSVTNTLDIKTVKITNAGIAVSTTSSVEGLHYICPVLDMNINSTLTRLDIPEYINGRCVNAITEQFLTGDEYLVGVTPTESLQHITIPKTIKYITAHAFDEFKGTELIFPEDPTADIHIKDGALNLFNSAISQGTYKECSLILPKSIKEISPNAFAAVNSSVTVLNAGDYVPNIVEREIYIKCETPYDARPTLFTLPRNGRIVFNNILYHIIYNGD